MLFGLQPMHWVIIIVVAIVIFAPSKLPEITRALGKTVREFRVGMSQPERPAAPSATVPPAERNGAPRS